MRDERRRVVAVGSVAGLTLLAVAAVWASGPIQWSTPRWSAIPPQRPLATAPPQPAATHVPASTATVPATSQKILLLVGAVVVCLVLLFVLYQVVRRIRATRQLRRDAVASDVVVVPTTSLASQRAPEAAPLAHGLALALQILDEDRSADDAIVRAWLGLEEASRASGAPRRPAETPAEYAARVISRFDADQHSVDVLLELYQDVRFGVRHADSDAIRTARDCIRRLADSWREDTRAGSR